jgi:Tfp pilus assembly protein PilO
MREVSLKGQGNRRQLWVYAVAVLFCADFLFYGFLPSRKRLLSLEQTRVQQQRLIETSAAQNKELPALKMRLKDAQGVVDHYETYIPPAASLGTFLQAIARIMTEHHLTEQVVVPGTEMQPNTIWCIPIHVNCRGSLKDVFGFFRDFQAMDRLVRIEKVILKNGPDFQGQVTMEADAVIFYGSRTEPESTTVAGSVRTEGNDGV